jgi:hypothetical protein
MPAAAVASRTPATEGISGKDAGARGEMVVDMSFESFRDASPKFEGNR